MSDFMNRRNFMKKAGVTSIGAGLTGALWGGKTAMSANEKMRVMVIGTNSRGLAHIQALTGIPSAEIAYICDVDDRAIAQGIKTALKGQKTEPKGIKDFRKALEDKSLDAITIASPDHWHAPMALLGLAAGKNVYVEKPCSHNPYEGELLIQAVAKHKKILQMGNQRRSFPNIQKAIGEIHQGAIGKAYFARTWYTNKRGPIGVGKSEPIPAWLDYELWQGPAPRRPYKSNLIHYNWHWFWHWGTGEALNNGTHEVDVARWALGVDWPTKITSSGGRYHYKDDWEAPDTQTIGFDFAEGKSITWEGRSCNSFPSERLARGVMVYGTEGSALLDNNSYTFYDPKNKVMKEVKEKDEADPTNTLSASGITLDRLHFVNFLEAIRGTAKQNSPIEEGHKSVTILHIGNVAWRVGRLINCDPANGHIKNDPEAAKLWRRDYEKGWEPKV